MKKLLGLTLSTILLLPAAAIAAPPAQAPAQAPNKSVLAPVQAPSKAVQAPTQAPAKTAMAPDNSGYRTYSYQPSMAPANYGYGYGSRYSPAYRTGPAAQGFYRADHKIVGPY